MWQPELEALARESLERLVVERMRATLARVLAEPAWARRLRGVHPEDVVRVEDWRALPFLMEGELRDAYPYGLACAREAGYVRIQMSSGTTGNPILNPYTASDVAQWGDVMARCYVAAGVGREDVIQITPSFGLFTGGFGFHYGAERLGAMVIPTGAGRTTLQLRLMRDLEATVVAATATYPLRLIEAAREERFDLASLSLRVGILGSEMWSDELRARIEKELHIRTFDIIGMTETGGPGLGIDCAARSGIHVWEDHYYPEVVDPATGAVVPDGTEGALAVSPLTREGRPLRGAGPGESADGAPARVGRDGAQRRAGHDAPVPDLPARVRGRPCDPGGARRASGSQPVRRPRRARRARDAQLLSAEQLRQGSHHPQPRSSRRPGAPARADRQAPRRRVRLQSADAELRPPRDRARAAPRREVRPDLARHHGLRSGARRGGLRPCAASARRLHGPDRRRRGPPHGLRPADGRPGSRRARLQRGREGALSPRHDGRGGAHRRVDAAQRGVVDGRAHHARREPRRACHAKG